jgi:hypothetical protein
MTNETKGAASAALVNRRMTSEELRECRGARYGYVFDAEPFESRLVVVPRFDRSGFMLYGDLRAAFFSHDSDSDNHDVADLLTATTGFAVYAPYVTLDTEAATFFAYVPDETVARNLADYIAGMVTARRARRAVDGIAVQGVVTSTRSKELAYWRGFADAITQMTAEPGNRLRLADAARDNIARLEAE